MEKTLTVKELINLLQSVDETLPVYISGVGLSPDCDWDAPLEFEEATVDVYNGKCRIHVATI
jgi:hypothetical protein